MRRFFKTKEQYLAVIQAWKDSCRDKNISFAAEHFALYAIIRDKDPRKCFAKPEQQSMKKLRAQGKHGDETYFRCMDMITHRYRDNHLLVPFRNKLTKEDLDVILALWAKAA